MVHSDPDSLLAADRPLNRPSPRALRLAGPALDANTIDQRPPSSKKRAPIIEPEARPPNIEVNISPSSSSSGSSSSPPRRRSRHRRRRRSPSTSSSPPRKHSSRLKRARLVDLDQIPDPSQCVVVSRGPHANSASQYLYYLPSSPSPALRKRRHHKKRKATSPVGDHAARRTKRTNHPTTLQVSTSYTGPDPPTPQPIAGKKALQKRKHVDHTPSTSSRDASPSFSGHTSSSAHTDDDTHAPEPTPKHASPPPEDYKAYSLLITRLASALQLTVDRPPPTESGDVYEDILSEHVQPVHLTFIKSLLQLMKDSWAKPSSVPQIPRRTDALYKTYGSETDFLHSNPLPNSQTVKATQGKARSRSDAVPNNKEGKKLDLFGKRQYSLATFSARAANYIAAMGAYQRHLWAQALPLFNGLPDEGRLKGMALYAEAMTVSKQERIAARHVVDASSRQATTSIALRRHAWLRAATLPEDARARIEDMPFDGVGLFNTKTDEVLKEHQQMKRTASSYSSQSSFKPFRQQWRRPYNPPQGPAYQPRSFNERPKHQTTYQPFNPRRQFNRNRKPFHRPAGKNKQGF